MDVQSYMYDMSRQVNKKENDEQTPERKIEKKSYNDILEYVRKEISKNHASELAEIITDPEAQVVLRDRIVHYLNAGSFTCAEDMNFQQLVNKIHEDMSSFGVITQYIYDKDVEEININAWNDIEVIYPTGLVKLDETFASPQQATDIVQKMCAYEIGRAHV